ncbi:DNA primase [Chloroflexota bacterium]
MGVIDEVKQRVDIAEVVSQSVALKKAGRNLVGLCPFHGEKNPSFFIYPEQQSWHCFGCNTGGDVFSFVMKKENMDFGEALRLLAQRAGVTVPSRFEREEEKGEKERLYQVNEATTKYFHELLLNSPAAEKARNYITNRSFSAKTLTDFQLGFSLNSWDSLKQHLLERGYNEAELLNAGLIIEAEDGKTHDRFRNKLMFPIMNIKGQCLGFGARVLDNSLPKYINSPQTPLFDKSGSLYGINLAAASIRQQNMAVIVEGYIDVIIAHQNGFNNVIASMGTSVTEKQVSSLKKLAKNIALALDADAAGEEAMLRGVSYENVLETEVRVIILPEGRDPDDVIKENADTWRKLLSEALPIMDYAFNMVASKLDLTTPKDKSLAVESLLPLVAEMKDVIRKAHYLQKLARLVKISERTLEAELSKIKTRPDRVRAQTPGQEKATSTLRSILSNRLEEGCLALLLLHPELKNADEELPPEYFENSENREIFIAWQQTDDLSALKENLDITIYEHLDSLVNRSLPSNQIEQRYADYTHRLHERYLKNLEAKRAEKLALEAERGGTGADLAKLEEEGEEGMETAVQLREFFAQKGRKWSEPRRK